MRKQVSLDGVWKFCPAFPELEYNQSFMNPLDDAGPPPSSERHDTGWIEPGFDDGPWIDFPIPHSWNKAVPALWSYEGVGWFRRSVDIPPDWEGKRVSFTCESANYRSVLYVNGVKAGSHDGGYTPFSIEIDGLLRYGQKNTLAVSVDNLPKPERCPGGQYGWWNYGGMFRSTGLLVTEVTHIRDVLVKTEPGRETSTVTVSLTVAGKLGDCDLLVAATLSEGDDRIACTVQESVSRASVELKLVVHDAKLWSPGSPNLYSLRIELRDADGGEVRDTWDARIGIRSIRVEGPRLLLNDEALLVKGVNRHPEYPGVGHTENEELLLKDLELVRWIGANAIRCHYPNSPRTFELCDEMGILLLCEVPLYQWGRPEVKADSPKALDSAKSQLREMIEAYRNHPSVFMWSVSNECMTKPRRETEEYRRLTEMTVAGNKELVDLAHELDPTRPVVEVSNCWPGDPVFEKTDLSAVNLYIGAKTPHISTLHTLTDRMHERLGELRSEYPDKPILIGEFGSWAVPGLMTDYFPGEPYQAALIENYWNGMMEEENVVGGFIWCFSDYDVHRRFEWDYEFRIAYGLFDLERHPKASAEAVRRMWSERIAAADRGRSV